jgi:hypothetical protein
MTDEVQASFDTEPPCEFQVGRWVVAPDNDESRELAHPTQGYHSTVKAFALEAVATEENKGFRLRQLYLSPSDHSICWRMKLVEIDAWGNYMDPSRIEVIGSQDVVPYKAARGMNLLRHANFEDAPFNEPANGNDRSP